MTGVCAPKIILSTKISVLRTLNNIIYVSTKMSVLRTLYYYIHLYQNVGATHLKLISYLSLP